jgi:protein-S-isoprenylcysteine O-methyltransferase Ste14
MYLGMMTMLFGLALTLGTLPFYAVAVSFFLIIETTFCPYEEAKLTTAFGESFSRYATRVRRWL